MTALAVAPAVEAPLTRTERLDCGLLVDATAEARRLRWPWPVHITEACWAETVQWDEEIESAKTFPSIEDTTGRLRDLLWVARVATRAGRGNRVTFDLHCVPPYGAGVNKKRVWLVATIGPHDDLKPVVTIDLAADGGARS